MRFVLLAACVYCAPTPGLGEAHLDLVDSQIKLPAALIKAPAPISIMPTTVKQTDLVNSLIAAADMALTKKWLVTLTEFPERYYLSDNGMKSAEWIRDQVNALQSSLSPKVKLNVTMFSHSWKKQPSVIARLESIADTAAKDIIVVGTHFDTLGKGSGKPEPNNNPGADDCASGSSVIAESLRVLVSQQFVPKRPIEFHWYAAEEVGLKGSMEVAADYAKRQVSVFSYLNLDQSGYLKPGYTATAGVFTDFTNKAATAFIRNTLKAYTTIGQKDSRCGYRCTDHASWDYYGYITAFVAEAPFEASFPNNDQVKPDGSALDTVEIINMNHLMQFVRNTLGFVVELSLAA